MPEFHERIFQLALEELAEQERQTAELRARVSPLLAAGAVVASLLARPALGGHHQWYQWAVIAVGVAGGLGLLTAALSMLLPREFGFSVNAPEAAMVMWREGVDTQPGVDFALADALHERRERNRDAADRLGQLLTFAIIALACEAIGFAAAAALAS